MKPRSLAQAGFSYIECLLALFLSSLLLAAVVQFTMQVLQIRQQQQQAIELQQTGRFALESMVRMLRNTTYIYSPATGLATAEICFQDPDYPNPTGAAAAKRTVTYRLGSPTGLQPHSIYQTAKGTSQPFTENTIANLRFSSDNLSPQQIVVEFDCIDSRSFTVVEHVRTSIWCMNVSP